MNDSFEELFGFSSQIDEMPPGIKELIITLESLVNMVDMVHDAFEKTGATMKEGARLQGLSSVTGESVAKLYEFERGLEAVGRKASYLPTIFADMQRALSATDEKGDRMKSLFAQMHLNIDKLRGEDTADAVVDVAGALGKFDVNQATHLGNQIFGRFQTETVLAMARNIDLFRGQMLESSQTGALLEQYSKIFDQVRIGRADLNNDTLGLRTVVAGGIVSGMLRGDDFKNMWSFLVPSMPGDAAIHAKHSKETGSRNINLEQDHHHPEFTSLEKMGFIMSGTKVQNPYDERKIDLLQKIVHNTSVQTAGRGWGAAPNGLEAQTGLLNTYDWGKNTL